MNGNSRSNPEEDIIAHTAQESQSEASKFWLQFHLNGNGTEWIDQGLPTPTYHEIINRGYILAYALDGFFGTQNGSEYLNDIIARFLLTFKGLKPSRIKEKPLIDARGTYYPKIYKLKELQALKSLSNKTLPRASADKFDDFTFWAIKFYCEDLIRSQGIPTADQLIQFAVQNFEGSERSTLKAKCRSVWNYYEQRNWKLPEGYQRKIKDDKELALTRSERAKSNAIEREEKAKRKVISAITGLMAASYKKKNGSWHIGKIAEDTNLYRDTVSKHLKEIENDSK